MNDRDASPALRLRHRVARTHVFGLVLSAALLPAVTAGASEPASPAVDPTPAPLQARLDALQRIVVTEARAPAASAPASAAVAQALDAAAEVEAGSAPPPAAQVQDATEQQDPGTH